LSIIKVLAAPACYLISDETGSDPTAIYELMYSLSLNHSVSIYAIANKIRTHNPLPKRVKLAELNVDYGGSLIEQAIFILKYYRIAKKLVREKKFDVLHHMYPPIFGNTFNPLVVFDKVDLPFVLGPAMYNVPLPAELMEDLKFMKWGHSWGELKSNLEDARDQTLNSFLLKFRELITHWFLETVNRAEVIITVNNFTRRAYEKITSSKKIKVIPYGVNTEKFPYSPTPRNYDIVTLGGLYKRRGVHYLIMAMPKIIKEFPETRLHIAGDGPQRIFLSRLSEKLGIRNNVIFHGLIPHTKVASLYKACRTVVLPTLHESFGLILLEAMSSGRPVVATDAIGPREIVVNGKNGYVVPMGDPNALAEAICKLLGDYDLSYRMGLEGRRLVEEKYDWNIIASQYHEIYEKLVYS
jgi:glycosyltransferase involved in cell wall biosynthesis